MNELHTKIAEEYNINNQDQEIFFNTDDDEPTLRRKAKALAGKNAEITPSTRLSEETLGEIKDWASTLL